VTASILSPPDVYISILIDKVGSLAFGGFLNPVI